MSQLRRLIDEIHRRSIWQVLGLYLAASWVVLQVVATFAEQLFLPGWVFSGALIFLGIGLPILLATAFLQEGFGSKPREAASGLKGLLTWRRAITGGVLAFALLGIGSAGWLATRALGIGPAGTLVAKGLLEEQATIVVASFASSDSLLGRVATEAMRIEVSQSSVVRLAEPAFVAEALRRMGRDPNELLDLDAAREVAVREGLPAVLTGAINSAGGRYLLSAELVGASDGRVLISHKGIAEDSAAILSAIDDLSKRIRERIGESLGTLRGDPALEQVTTPSLEALEKYSRAVQAVDVHGQTARGLALLEEAVAIDPEFAMAHRKLAIVLGTVFEEPTRMVRSVMRAYENRDRLTERERYMATAAYHWSLTGEWEQVVIAYQNLLEIDPDHAVAANNLGVLFQILRDDERAEEMYALSVQLEDSTSYIALANLVWARFNQGDTDGARAVMAVALERFPDAPMVEWYEYQLAAASGGYEQAQLLATAFAEKYGADLSSKALAAGDRASLAAVRGRVAEARTRASEALLLQAERDLPAEYLEAAIQLAWIELLIREDAERALEVVGDAERRYDLSEIEALDRPYLALAELYAAAGRPARARGLLVEMESEVPPELRGGEQYLPALHRARGSLALAEGDIGRGIEEYRLSDREKCLVCALVGLARAYELAGQRDSAIAVTQRFVETHYMFRFWNVWAAPGAAYGPSLERLARFYDEEGDLGNAARYYAMFVELWAEADEELQPRVRTAQARLEEILEERG